MNNKIALLFFSLFFSQSLAAQYLSLIKDINPAGSSMSYTHNHWVHQNILYFIADDGAHGPELWRTDGTEAGTWLLKDIYPGPEGISTIEFAQLGDLVIMGVNQNNDYAIWKTDGTEQGTTLVKSVAESGFYRREKLVTIGNYVMFRGPGNGNVAELWRTDGTTSGTKIVKDVPAYSQEGPTNLVSFNGKVYYFYDSGLQDGLWSSDGTEAGTVVVKPNGCPSNYEVVGLTSTPIGLFFVADDPTFGLELWVSAGTTAGTKMVKNINPSAVNAGAYLGKFLGKKLEQIFWHGKFYFMAGAGYATTGLWATDGTEAGTKLIRANTNGTGPLVVGEIDTIAGAFLFRGATDTYGSELWLSDGTTEGTNLIKDCFPSNSASLGSVSGTELVSYAGKVWSIGHIDIYGKELWVTDGTEGGTFMVEDFYPGAEYGCSGGIVQLGDHLVVIAQDTSDNLELYSLYGPAVGLDEPHQLPYSLTITPNPVTDWLNIRPGTPLPERTRVVVVNALGQILLNEIWQDYAFPCQTWPSGIYYLHLQNEEGLELAQAKLMKL